MRYKADFRPLQLFSEGDWREFGADEVIEVRELPGDRIP
jgi:arginyl-tRNA--protein-N-Asp/Glu arginylyltransferase